MISYNGEPITYDGIGNPLTYRGGMTMTWQNGRQLASLQKGVNTISYTYGEDGLRTKKNVNGYVSTYYRDDSGRLIGCTLNASNSSHAMWFYYNPGSTTPDSIVYDGNRYIYFKNNQGDILGIVDGNGNLVAAYDYDSWGKCAYVYDANLNVTTDPGFIGNVNPLRYRGYEYDTETGLYYLQSRYYDPTTGRFVNADGMIGANNSLNTNNLFVYCGNNPVNKSDPSGMREVGCEFDERDQPLADIASKILAADEARGLFGAESSTVSEVKSETAIIPDPSPITIKTGTKTTTVISKHGDSSRPISVYAKRNVEHPLKSSYAGIKLNVSAFTLNVSVGLDNLAVSGSIRRGNKTDSFAVKAVLAELKVGFEGSTDVKWDENTTNTSYANGSISGWALVEVLALATTGQPVTAPAA